MLHPGSIIDSATGLPLMVSWKQPSPLAYAVADTTLLPGLLLA